MHSASLWTILFVFQKIERGKDEIHTSQGIDKYYAIYPPRSRQIWMSSPRAEGMELNLWQNSSFIENTSAQCYREIG